MVCSSLNDDTSYVYGYCNNALLDATNDSAPESSENVSNLQLNVQHFYSLV